MRPFLFICLFCISKLNAQQVDSILTIDVKEMNVCSQNEWKLIWSDEFDGNQLDKSKWFSYFPFTENGSDSCAVCRGMIGAEFLSDSNLQVKDGSLHIIAKKEKATWFGRNFEFTSGNIFSMPGFKYGRFEIRCKLPKGRGFWPAFWTAGDGVIEEIDVFESKGHIQTQTQSNYHHCYNQKGCQQPKWHWTADQKEWNVYAIEWDPFFVKWYMNKRLVRVLPGYKNQKNNKPISSCILKKGSYMAVDAFPKNKHRIIAGLGIEGPFGGKVNSKTKFPSTMEIDYIRVYQRANSE